LFDVYQQFFEGTFSEADLEEQAGEPVEQLRSFADKFSYAYGYLIQYNMQMQGIYVNLEGFSSGLADAFYGIELSYSEEEIDQLFDSYQKMLATRYAAMLSEYAADNLADAEAFLLENGQKEDVITTASGLQYKVIEEGTGAKPTDGDTVELDYLLTLLDGSAADSSYSRGEPAVFEVDSLIPGFIEGLKLMNEGSYYRFYVHPSLGYKDVGNEAIPPNSALIFDVELHRILN
jgi:FKBP-type peptidyl-prolyl cis-trans isomerase